MKFVRYQKDSRDVPKYGWIYDNLVGEIKGDIFGEFLRLEATEPVYSVKFLPPVIPGKIIGVEWNYLDQVRAYERKIPDFPSLFMKPVSSLIGMNGEIELPSVSQLVEHECELAVVIGKRAKNILPEEAFSCIFGYTIANDITARDLQESDETWTRAKGFDTFCPMGPCIVTDFESADALLTCRVNGVLRQMASTRDLIFPVSSLIAFISSVMTLNPGDVILTGSPAGSGILTPGDMIESEIDGIGQLVNTVALREN